MGVAGESSIGLSFAACCIFSISVVAPFFEW